MIKPNHHGLVLDAKGGSLHVVSIPTTAPGKHQIAIRLAATAINPVDRYMLSLGRFITPWLAYPAILGSDAAGEVVAVGEAVTRFRVGQRVLGFALGTDKGRGWAEGAFQERAIIDEALASAIPDAISFEEAAVLPLGLSTAASGLFQSDYLALQHPTADSKPAGKSVLIWGGSTSVGSNAVQLATRAGYDVVATASPRNHSYVAGLGARAVFDYRAPTTTASIVSALAGRQVAGAMAIGEGSLRHCIAVLRRCEGRRFVAVATPAMSFETLLAHGTGWPRMLPFFVQMGMASACDGLAARLAGVTSKFIWGSSLKDNEVGAMIFRDFLPEALAERRYVPAPPPLVVGHGLDAIPAAFAAQAKVSAGKIVVTL